MKYAIIGSGKIGSALARTFARRNIEVAVANSRGPETLASLTKKLGPSVHPQSIHDAYEAEMIFLAAVSYTHLDVYKRQTSLRTPLRVGTQLPTSRRSGTNSISSTRRARTAAG